MIVLFLRWLQTSDLFKFLRAGYAYPILLSLHMVALAFFGGMILVTNLRLLGLGKEAWSISDVLDGLRVPKRVGFAFAATCGVLMFGCKAEEYAFNPWLQIKLTFFTLIAINYLIFRRGVYNNAAELDRAQKIPSRAKLAAILSLFLWTGVACAGRGIGYIEPTLEHIVSVSPGMNTAAQPGSKSFFTRI